MSILILVAVAGYLLGSIPFGYLLVRIFRGEDVRQSGSGNIGATNVSRKSPALGVVTLLLDALKGTLAVMLTYRLAGAAWGRPKPYVAMAVAALFAVVGHVFPVWLTFRGGKGVATALGSFVVMTPKAALIAAMIFILVVAFFRYVSLGSIVAVASFPLILLKEMPEDPSVPWVFGCVAATSLLIIVRHHENIRRLLTHSEPRFALGRR